MEMPFAAIARSPAIQGMMPMLRPEHHGHTNSVSAAQPDRASDADRIRSLCRDLALARTTAAHRSRVMAVAGHDLKQPLQIISRALERLAPHATEASDRMWADAASNQIARLASGLTDLARASHQAEDDIVGAVRPFSISSVMNAVEQAWWLEAAATGIDLRFAHCSAIVSSDRRSLETILGNLVGNAIKYSGPGKKVLVGCRIAGSDVRLQVLDQGCGIAVEDCQRIFLPFEQVDLGAEGLGLGLHLVRSLCEALGHILSLQSRPGHGSSFTITMPLLKD